MSLLNRLYNYFNLRKWKKNKNFAYGHGPIWDWFGLTYSSYLVLPRRSLQSMPWSWQEKFVKLLNEMENNIPDFYGEQGSNYMIRRRNYSGKFMHDPLSEYRHQPPLEITE